MYNLNGKVAESLGYFGIQVKKPSEFEGALDQALKSDKPAIIDVKTPYSWYRTWRLASQMNC